MGRGGPALGAGRRRAVGANAAPAPGPGSPARITVALQLGAAGSVVTMTPQEPDLGPLAAALGAAGAQAKDAIKDALGHSEQTDLGPLFTQFKLPVPAQSQIDVVGQTVAIRFDPAGAPAEHLFGGEDWGLFFDEAAVQGLMLARIPDSLKQTVPETFTATWQPVGDVPAVKLSVSGTRAEPAISGIGVLISVRFTVNFDCRFALKPETPNSLRTTVVWVAHAYIDPGIGIVEEKAEEKIEEKISELAQIGGELPSRTLTPAMVTSYGYLPLVDAGRFCGFDWPDPASTLDGYVRGPARAPRPRRGSRWSSSSACPARSATASPGRSASSCAPPVACG